MKWPFPVGTRVNISVLGIEMYAPGDSNPEGVSGTVYYPGFEDGWVHVQWDNG